MFDYFIANRMVLYIIIHKSGNVKVEYYSKSWQFKAGLFNCLKGQRYFIMRMSFPQEIIDELKYYVYIYIDPDSNEIFYVGKGKTNRVFQHLNAKSESEKVKKINEIRANGKEPKIEILVHGIKDEFTAKKIESATIDLMGIHKLTNIKRGWESGIFGRMGIDEIISHYKQEEVNIDVPAILIRINKLYRYGMQPQELYDVTRGYWKINTNRAKKANYAFCVYEGIVKEVYEIVNWLEANSTFSNRDLTNADLSGRYEFIGKISNENIRKKYLNKSVKKYFSKGTRNPIKYVNC